MTSQIFPCKLVLETPTDTHLMMIVMNYACKLLFLLSLYYCWVLKVIVTFLVTPSENAHRMSFLPKVNLL